MSIFHHAYSFLPSQHLRFAIVQTKMQITLAGVETPDRRQVIRYLFEGQRISGDQLLAHACFWQGRHGVYHL